MTLDTLTPGDVLTYIAPDIERMPGWYGVRYGYRNASGEYYHTRKFYDLADAERWQADARAMLNATDDTPDELRRACLDLNYPR